MADNPYGPVTITDSTRLTDDDWDLPPVKYLRYSGAARAKSLCFELRQHRRSVVISLVALCLTVLVAMVIILFIGLSSERDLVFPITTEPKWQSTHEGLEFYPVPEDKGILIKFAPNDFSKPSTHHLKKSLDSILANYSSTKQLNEALFTDCTPTFHPKDKACRISRTMFGDDCSSHRNYGYQGAQPCVFIQLNLPNGETIRPITEESPLWEVAKLAGQDLTDPNHVPVTCNGTTPSDTSVLMSVEGYGPHGERIMYYPDKGLMTYIYRERNTNFPFLNPGVMVQFTSLVSRVKVHVTCVAWGQLYDSHGGVIEHRLLSTHFALYVNHE